jgi:hypothetical protein
MPSHLHKRILDRIAPLFIRPSLLESMGRQDVPQIMRAMRQHGLWWRAAACVGIVDPIPLNRGSPGLIKLGGVVGRIQAGCLHRLNEQCAGILCRPKQDTRWRLI